MQAAWLWLAAYAAERKVMRCAVCVCLLQTSSMTSGDLGPLNETAQAVRVMKEKYMLWQQRLDSLVAQVPAHLPLCTHSSHV
jgi:hypothetical protein